MSAPNPYEPPRSAVTPQPSRVPAPLLLVVYSVLSLKALQLVTSIWLVGRGVAAVWSLLDVALHFAAGVLLLKGRRIALAPLAFTVALGVMVSAFASSRAVPRAIYLVGLPVLIMLVTVRHWSALRKAD